MISDSFGSSQTSNTFEGGRTCTVKKRWSSSLIPSSPTSVMSPWCVPVSSPGIVISNSVDTPSAISTLVRSTLSISGRTMASLRMAGNAGSVLKSFKSAVTESESISLNDSKLRVVETEMGDPLGGVESESFGIERDRLKPSKSPVSKMVRATGGAASIKFSRLLSSKASVQVDSARSLNSRI